MIRLLSNLDTTPTVSNVAVPDSTVSYVSRPKDYVLRDNFIKDNNNINIEFDPPTDSQGDELNTLTADNDADKFASGLKDNNFIYFFFKEIDTFVQTPAPIQYTDIVVNNTMLFCLEANASKIDILAKNSYSKK